MKKATILFGLATLTLGAAIHNNIYAESADFSVDVKSASLQLTVPESINIELQPTSSAAVFDSRNLTFNVATNNPTGYTVTMSVPQTAMPHSSLASTTLPTLESTTSEVNFPANKWGYKTTGDYNPVALTNTDAAWNFDGPTNSQNHTVTLGAKVDSLQPAGIYETTITFTVVVNPNSPKQTLSFDGNNADSGSMPVIQLYGGESVTLPANRYMKSSKSFNGWNTKANKTGSGYGDEDEYTAPELTESSTVTLFAQWAGDGGGSGSSAPAGKTLARAYEEAYLYNGGNFDEGDGSMHHRGMYVPIKDEHDNFTGRYFEADSRDDYDGIAARDLRFAMQDIDLLVDGEKICDRATVIGSEAHVIDLRDHKSYWITKLTDGKCWMTQNLDFNLDSTQTLTPDDTDIPANWQPTRSTLTMANVSATGTIPSWSHERYIPYSFDPGDWYATSVWYNGSDENICPQTDYNCSFLRGDENGKFARTPFPENGEHGHIGNYYNAAAAGARTDVLETRQSICPKGWQMPEDHNGDQTDWAILAGSYDLFGYNIMKDDSAMINAPLYFVRGGQISHNNLNRLGYRGEYMSDPSMAGRFVPTIDFTYSGIKSAASGYQETGWGYTVRCRAK